MAELDLAFKSINDNLNSKSSTPNGYCSKLIENYGCLKNNLKENFIENLKGKKNTGKNNILPLKKNPKKRINHNQGGLKINKRPIRRRRWIRRWREPSVTYIQNNPVPIPISNPPPVNNFFGSNNSILLIILIIIVIIIMVKLFTNSK